MTLAQAAVVNGNTENTMRGHLKAVFVKAGVNRQSELMNLFAGSFGAEAALKRDAIGGK